MKTILPLLENERVALLPLQLDHAELLWPALQGLDLHQYGPNEVTTLAQLKTYIEVALADAEKGLAIPYCIYDKVQEHYLGSTRFGNIDARNKVLHIGWTWIAVASQGTGINTDIKHLMLAHAFNVMGFEKIEFRIDERNLRSRKAVEKLGAVLEGILRENMVVKNGYRRSSCCYGILKREWLP